MNHILIHMNITDYEIKKKKIYKESYFYSDSASDTKIIHISNNA